MDETEFTEVFVGLERPSVNRLIEVSERSYVPATKIFLFNLSEFMAVHPLTSSILHTYFTLW